MVDETYGNRYMRAVGMKGLGTGAEMHWLIHDMHKELKSWGYPGGENNPIILKCDGENAIGAVRDRLGRYHGGQVTPEDTPPGEKECNGTVEEAGKTIRGIAKTFKEMIEEKIGAEIPVEGVIMQWLIRWAAMLHSRFKIGEDGKTAYERQKGRKCNEEVIPFGETVMYKRLKGSGEKKKVMENNWLEGLWLGHSRTSNEVLIGTKEGVVKAWAVKGRPEETRLDKEFSTNME